VADVNAAFMQQIFHVAEQQPKPDVHHHSQANDLRAGFEVAEGRDKGARYTLADVSANVTLLCKTCA
jgi:hypothetical protein